ncbi:MAG TPA: GNAT family N-acetyltransferase [Chitinophagaceae bacterium]|nr:GNAT family N-acetyltransferase [Chitinophagaceae bacterium]
MMVIKKASGNDAALIAALSRKTFYETFAAFNSKKDMDKFMTEQFTADKLIREVLDPANIFFIATDDDIPLGYVFLRQSDPPKELGSSNAIEIARIYALNAAIGTGVGKLLMQQCLNTAVALKKDMIWLGVWEKNTRAVSFYEKWGFKKFSTHVFMLGDDAQTDWLMQKELHH